MKVKKVHFEERYSFPMGGPLPRRGQRVVGVGATARMVHPASGYMVGYALRCIPAMVEAAARGLQQFKSEAARRGGVAGAGAVEGGKAAEHVQTLHCLLERQGTRACRKYKVYNENR